MAYTRTKVQRIINRVRRFINQVPFTNENVSNESHVLGSPTTSLSDDFIIKTIEAACRAIVSGCKASHAYHAIQEYSVMGATPDLASQPVVRLLKSRVEVDNHKAVFRSVDRARSLEDTGRAGTTSFPAYSYDNGELEVFPTLVGDATLTADYVKVPTIASANDELPLDERFESAILHYSAAMCYQRLQRMDLHDMAFQVYEDEIAPFLIDTRLGLVDDQEQDVE